MTTRGVRFARDESRRVRLPCEGSLEVQPGQTAARLHPARARGRVVASSIVVFPLLSGLFFGIISGLAVLPRGGAQQATVVGALVGGIMLTSNAIALCIVQASANSQAAQRAQAAAPDVNESKAS
jgi:hypothetical protein